MNDNVDRSRTPLLTLITQEAIDRDYQVAASRRAPGHHDSPGLRAAVVGVLAGFAVLVTVAAVQTSQNAEANDASREGLIGRIQERREKVAELQREIAELREANIAAEQTLRSLGTRFGNVQAERTSLGVLSGFETVRGDGVRVTVDNPPYADADTEVRDSDLALLADALWGAGAEAVAINGQRLTAAGGIRTSGVAVEVNGVGIAPPYTIIAIGDQRSLSANFVDSGAGLAFIAITDQFGYAYEMENDDDLRLAAAPAVLRRLTWATVDPKPGPTPGGTS